MRDIEEHKTPEEWYHDSFERLVNEKGMSETEAGEILDPGYEFIVTDPLTGVYNRRILFKSLETLTKKKVPFCVDMLDVDSFKKYNDTYGHGQGDKALIEITHAIEEGTRGIEEGTKSEGTLTKYNGIDIIRAIEEGTGLIDIVGRYGGEEFTVILPYTDLEQGKIVTERIRKNVEDLVIEAASDNLPKGFERETISQGLTFYDGKSVKTAVQLLKEADAALYKAKDEEKNCVRVYQKE